MNCIVKHCGSHWKPKSGIKFHSFPKDEKRRRHWLSILPLKGKFFEHAKICSLHFKAESYDRENPGRLIKTASPFYMPQDCDCCCNATKFHVDGSHSGSSESSDESINNLSTGSSHSDSSTSSDESINVLGEEEPPTKRPRLRVKSPRETEQLLHQKVAHQKLKIENLSNIIDVVRKYTTQSEIENILNGNYANICRALKENPPKARNVQYSAEVKAFALTLRFYSPRAYEYLRTVISLPHETALWRSISSFNCDVGFLSEVMEFLKNQVREKPHLKNVAMIIGSMSLKTDVQVANKTGKVFGYVDLGSIPVCDPEQLATEALVFQIVSYTNNFKCPIGYFFTPSSLPGELLGQLTCSALVHLNEIGITVRSITCDGAKCNIKALENLGCCSSPDELKPYFVHPNGVTNVYCVLDAAHMYKLARNAFAEYTMTSAEGEVSFKYVKLLHDIQQQHGLKFSNKLTKGHITCKKNMNVSLAAQTLSSSVADAIDFLRQAGDENFRDSEATTKFIRVIDRLFENMNTRSPFGKHCKSPLSHQNKEVWQSFFVESAEYIRGLKISGTPVTRHPRKTFALGFLMNMISLTMLFDDLTTLTENPLKYLLTFKLSQDNLEIFFSLVRSRGETRDNPSPLEFRYILRKLLFGNSVQPSVSANCGDNSYETNHIIEFRNKTRTLVENSASDNDDYENNFINDIVKQLEGQQQSLFQKNIIYYIAGYIVKIMKKNSCQYCHDILTTTPTTQISDHDYAVDISKQSAFTAFINRGKLFFPSEAVNKICLHCNQLFKQAVLMGQLQTSRKFMSKLVMAVMQKFYPIVQDLFVPRHPITDSLICTDLHETELIKFICTKFLQIRMSSYLKNHTQRMLGAIRTKRHKTIHKTILFSQV